MTLDPLLAATWPIIVHTMTALGAFVLGIVQLAAPKGTVPHRIVGWAWVALMAVTAASSFLIHEVRQVGLFSWIHILSVVTLASLPAGVLAARRGDIRSHKFTMLSLFCFALVVAGVFTLMPGRILHAVVFK